MCSSLLRRPVNSTPLSRGLDRRKLLCQAGDLGACSNRDTLWRSPRTRITRAYSFSRGYENPREKTPDSDAFSRRGHQKRVSSPDAISRRVEVCENSSQSAR